ncbi:MAG TPA: TetR/AcrR family transcriptional regulator [Sporichthyaceae bacterium]|nr:TetR/AcrR family transcriptional regulator [Sporichthyaceae bacterium]
MHKPELGRLARPGHRTLLIRAMRDLTLAKGLPATTVDEVCERAGVTKGSFYHHFVGKEEIAEAALQAHFDDLHTALTTGEWTRSTDPTHRWRAFVANAAQVCAGPVLADGCLLGLFSLELAEQAPRVRERVTGMFDQLRCVARELIAQAAEAKDRQLDVDAVAAQFLVVLEGAALIAKAHDDRAVASGAMAFFAAAVEHLLECSPSLPGRRPGPVADRRPT